MSVHDDAGHYLVMMDGRNTMFGSFGGFNIHLDPELSPTVCEFRNHKGEVLYADTASTMSAPEASRPSLDGGRSPAHVHSTAMTRIELRARW